MSEKKNIDRLFREKFKDFEAAPPEDLWGNIAQELQERKKKKVTPLWYKLSGVAAVLLLGFLLTLPFFNDDFETNKVPVVLDNKQEIPAESNSLKIEDDIKTNETVTEAEASAVNESITHEAVAPLKGTIKNNNPVNSKAPGTAVAYEQKQRNSNKNTGQSNREPYTDKKLKSNEAVVSSNDNNTSSKENAPDNGTGLENNHSINKETLPASKKELAISEAAGNKTDSPDNSLRNDKNDLLQQELENKANSDSSLTVVHADTAVTEEVNPLEKILQEKENGIKDEDEETALADANTRWNIKPQVAPVFYNSFSEGSPIDGQFASNSKTYEKDISYGVGIDYALTDRLSVRSAVNKVNLSYSTNNVEFYASMSAQTNNVSAAKTDAANIVVQNPGTPIQPPTGVSNFTASDFTNQTFNGSMLQQMGYIEVPLELSYGLLESRFGIELIGGMSTLFLDDNSVSVISDQGYMSEVGEASNLNNVSFTTNLGVGFKYRLLPQMEVNFEPTFKYQVNTFSDNPGNFKPYFIGLYSGISFKF